jgi:hypothetical protein
LDGKKESMFIVSEKISVIVSAVRSMRHSTNVAASSSAAKLAATFGASALISVRGLAFMSTMAPALDVVITMNVSAVPVARFSRFCSSLKSTLDNVKVKTVESGDGEAARGL